jgi:hypothetical protein
MMTQHQAVAGTPFYMPPEQLEAGKVLDARSDVFALGITIYQLGCGEFPHRTNCTDRLDVARELESWKAAPPLRLDQQGGGMTAGFAKVVAKAMAVDPADRYQNMGELLAELEKTVFVSWRMGECKNEVKVLQPALEALGIKVIVMSELPGGDLLRAVKGGMEEADLFIIMGTQTYGKKTSGKIDTWVEMHDIKESGKPSFLINMNPEKSLKRFEVEQTNEIFDLDTVAWHRWAVGDGMDGELPQQILRKLEELGQKGQGQRVA